MLTSLKKKFIDLALANHVLTFGEFTLKSGRISPYFFNMGLFYNGLSLQQVGECYADTLQQHNVTPSHLFGPAYKGISLASATAIALAHAKINVNVTFNRKEIKDHGEGGSLIGAPLTGKNIIMIDDVITAGTAFREAQQQIHNAGGNLNSVIIALDRCERGLTEKSSVQEIREQGIEVYSIINLFDLINYLKEQNDAVKVKQLELYQDNYGA